MWIYKVELGFIDIPNKITYNVYTVGCEHNCTGCHMEHLQDINYPLRASMTTDYIDKLISDTEGLIDGFCFMGGDPLLQKDELIYIAEYIKNKYKNLMLFMFTGYNYNEIDNKIKNIFDIIIDGKWEGIPYYDDKSNQKIYYNGDIISYKEFEQLTKEE